MGRLVRARRTPIVTKARDLARPLKMLVLADPRGDLRGAYEEGKQILDFMDREKEIINATLRSYGIGTDFIREKIRNFDMVHFAGHSEFNAENPAEGGWRLTDGLLKAKDISKMARTAAMPALIFSNACQSARTEEWRIDKNFQDEIFGLANAFILAGVKHYIGTFWEILDEPSRLFALEFYKQIISGMTIGEATRLSRLELINKYGEETIVWASYLLYGDPTFNYIEQKEQTKEPAPYLNENVQFTVYRPTSIIPEKWYPLIAFAHLSGLALDSMPDEPDPIKKVEMQAQKALGELRFEYQDLRQDSIESVPHKGKITFMPEIKGIEFNPRFRRFQWQESVHQEDFRMRASTEMAGQIARGRMSVFMGSIILAEITLSIQINYKETSNESGFPVKNSAKAYRRIFASYSHKDEAIVEELKNYANAVGDEYFRDMVNLRAGDVWDTRLKELIHFADIFQLFWSWNSIRSEYVEREWRFALNLNRSGFIRPVYWEEPIPELPERNLPPNELRKFHFQRIYPHIPVSHVHDDLSDHIKIEQDNTHLEKVLRERDRMDQMLQKKFRLKMAILVSDICGFTKFTEKRGDIASRLWVQQHHDIVLPIIKEHEGKILSITGDGVLASFPTTLSAVQGSMNIQKALSEYNKYTDPDNEIHISMGINSGEILLDGDYVAGDVVNIASRIESKAEADQILISKNAYEDVGGNEDVLCRAHGSFMVKGKSEPMELYRVVWQDEDIVLSIESKVRVSSPIIEREAGVPLNTLQVDTTREREETITPSVISSEVRARGDKLDFGEKRDSSKAHTFWVFTIIGLFILLFLIWFFFYK